MKVVWLMLLSVACLAAGWFWAGGFDWMLDVTWVGSWRFPIIKHLFTSSMVLWAGGWCYLLMAVFYLVMDVLGWRKWAYFFVVIGANPIFAYMIVRFVDFGEVSNRLLGGLARNLASLGTYGQTVGTALLALTAYAIFWCLLWYMYRKGARLRVCAHKVRCGVGGPLFAPVARRLFRCHAPVRLAAFFTTAGGNEPLFTAPRMVSIARRLFRVSPHSQQTSGGRAPN